uniref:Uncharacterized protein n=1 Tax=Globodera rostochiensis TaxID=31243 RepID=A0A914HAP2_GLORO
MLVIFPVDLSFAIIYPIYNILVIVIRAYRPLLSTVDFVAYCYWAYTQLFLHSLITVLAYIQFFKFASKLQRRNIVKSSPFEESKVHFRQLESQWI